jgi:putative sigma-54 modulation protein
MIVEYTGRHIDVTQKYKNQAEAGLKAIEKIVSGDTSAKVILAVDKYRMIAEVTLTEGSHTMVATCESSEMTTSLRDALSKVEQQAVRHRQKSTTTMRHPRTLDKGQALDGPESSPATA